MNVLLPYATALLLGSVHALEADHMATVTAFAVRRPAPLAAASFGIRWALGHGASVILAGLAIMLVGATVPAAAGSWLDRGVGLVLIGLGAWTSWHAAHLHSHKKSGAPGHAHLHSHGAAQDRHDHVGENQRQRAATMIGALHGLAGAAPAVALLQIARQESLMEGMAYLAAFAVGTAIGMAAYALITGFFMGRAAIASERLARGIGRLAGVSTAIIGFIWLLR
jgi:high-affinity nickel permease